MQLAFYDSRFGSLTDKLIAWKTGHPRIWSPFSHVELVLDPLRREDLQRPDRWKVTCASSSPRDGGVRTKSIDLNNGHWFIVDWPSADADDDCSRRFLAAQAGKPYDWLGVFGFVLRELDDFTCKDRWFCSSLAVAFLQDQGLLLHSDPLRTSPQSLLWTLLRYPSAACWSPGGGLVDMRWFKRTARHAAAN